MEEYKPRISDTEWWLVIAALGATDLVQIGLDFVGIGLALNSFIDVFVGMSLGLYLQMNGQSLVTPKRALGFLGAFVAEFIPLVNGLPLWVLDGLWNRHLAKQKDKKMAAAQKSTEAQLASQRAAFLRRAELQQASLLRETELQRESMLENAGTQRENLLR